jgi:hypothetical protein
MNVLFAFTLFHYLATANVIQRVRPRDTCIFDKCLEAVESSAPNGFQGVQDCVSFMTTYTLDPVYVYICLETLECQLLKIHRTTTTTYMVPITETVLPTTCSNTPATFVTSPALRRRGPKSVVSDSVPTTPAAKTVPAYAKSQCHVQSDYSSACSCIGVGEKDETGTPVNGSTSTESKTSG